MQAGGGPLTVTAHVVSSTDGKLQTFGPMGGGAWRDCGPSTLIRVDGIEIALITNNGQATDTAQLTSLGCDPSHKHTVVVKSNHHFRAAFEPLSREDGSGLGSMIRRTMVCKKVRRPVWPLDEIAD